MLAAAEQVGASLIVTENLEDFPQAALDPLATEADTPDAFLTDLFHRHPDRMVRIVREQTSALRNPPRSLAATLRTLARHAPIFVGLINPQRIHA